MQTEGNSICPASVGWHGVPSITYNTAGGCLPLPTCSAKAQEGWSPSRSGGQSELSKTMGLSVIPAKRRTRLCPEPGL